MWKSYSYLPGLVFFCLLSVQVSAQEEPFEITDLNLEAVGLSLDEKAKEKTASVKVKSNSFFKENMQGNIGGAHTSLVEGLSIIEFESALKKNLMGSFYYYKQLDEQQKDVVYQAYIQNSDLQNIRASILQASKNK